MDRETLKTCGHPMDLLTSQFRAMRQYSRQGTSGPVFGDAIVRDNPDALEPNAILIGSVSMCVLRARADSFHAFDLSKPTEPTFYGFRMVLTQAPDQFELAYLPGLVP